MINRDYHSSLSEGKARIIQEMVPGKQITLAHIIANPDTSLHAKLGLDPVNDNGHSAIGIVNTSPAEMTIIAGDIATKSSGVQLGFVDRFSGTLVITGTVSQVNEAVKAILSYASEVLGFAVCPVTRT
jgi:ethanolamine utilization protein EutS